MISTLSTSFARRVSFTFTVAAALAVAAAAPASAQSFIFSSGNPDGRIATASRPDSPGFPEIESADDFILTQETLIRQATFTGLVPRGVTSSDIAEVVVEIYRGFPLDSTLPPDGRVPTRNNSPSDVAFDSRDSAATDVNGKLEFDLEVVADEFAADNSVLDGIRVAFHGDGAVSGEEALFEVSFPRAFDLPAGHYFFIPQVKLYSGQFFWLSAPKPILAPGTPFMPDLQSWIRNEALAPDWLRIGGDIVGGAPAPAFNGSFSLHGIVSHRD
jgi:hypothetical protein